MDGWDGWTVFAMLAGVAAFMVTEAVYVLVRAIARRVTTGSESRSTARNAPAFGPDTQA